jgi:hypothetical protein
METALCVFCIEKDLAPLKIMVIIFIANFQSGKIFPGRHLADIQHFTVNDIIATVTLVKYGA